MKGKKSMRQKRVWPNSIVSFVAFFLALTAPALTQAGGEEVFHGEIADSQCAFNVHSLTQSHKEMLQEKTIGATDADCVWYCVKQRGGRFVLQNKGKVYKLDLQEIGKEFGGRKVKIIGTLDSKTNTIHVKSLELAEEQN
jgi:hypothetical protein